MNSAVVERKIQVNIGAICTYIYKFYVIRKVKMQRQRWCRLQSYSNGIAFTASDEESRMEHG